LFRSITTIPIATDSVNRLPWQRVFLLIPLMLTCSVLLPRAQAVTPAPDGGYPGFNTAEGQSALLSLTTGVFNTANGAYALAANTSGSNNTAVGTNALRFNTEGYSNTACGVFALYKNTAFGNTAIGYTTLL